MRLDPDGFYVWFDTWTLEVEFTNYGDRVADVGYITIKASSPGSVRAILPFRSLAPGETMRRQGRLLEPGSSQVPRDFTPETENVSVWVGGCYIFEGSNFNISSAFVSLTPATRKVSISRPLGLGTDLPEEPPETCIELEPGDMVMMTPLGKTELVGE